MGCWAFGVYQSDDSMDWEGELYEIAGLDHYEDDFDETAPAVRVALETALPKMLARLATSEAKPDMRTGYYKAVGYQMLACVLMRHGCAVPDEARKVIIEGILACPEYQMGKGLLAQAGALTFTEELLRANSINLGTRGFAGTVNRLTGRTSALERLAKEFGEYDAKGGTLYHYQDQGSLELYGHSESETETT